MKYFLLVISVCFVGVVFSQKDFKSDADFAKYIQKHLAKSKKGKSEYAPFLKGKECRAELRILRRVIEEGQPQLYRYASRKEIDKAFANVYEKCKRRIAYKEYVKGIGKIQNTIRAGHSGLGHSPGYVRFAKEFEVYFPFDIRYDGDDCKIYRNCSNVPKSTINDEIILVSINDRPIDSIIDEIRCHMDRDGESNDQAHRNITERFKLLYAELVDDPAVFHIKYLKSESLEPGDIEVDGLSLAEIAENRKSRYIVQSREVLSTNFDGNRAYLGLHTFSSEEYEKNGYGYKDYVKNFFEKVEGYGSNELYLDLRGNTGGEITNASYLLSFLIKDTVDYIATEIKKVKDFVYEPLFERWVKYSESMKVDTIDSKYFVFEQPKVIPAKNYAYSGKVYVIIDNLTRSCAASICVILDTYEDVVFIGEETGSPRTGSGGNTATIHLPYSKVIYGFPQGWNRNIAVNDNKDANGTMPDIPVNRKPMKFYDWDFYMDVVNEYLNPR